MYHVLTGQSSSSWVNGYGGGSVGESKARTLEAAIANKIVCSQTDHETRKKFQDMVGQTLQWVKQVGYTEGGKGSEEEGGNWGRSETYSTQYQPALHEEWMLGLETGQRGYIEAYVFLGGEKFYWNNKRFLLVHWYQNYKGSSWWHALLETSPTARPWKRKESWMYWYYRWKREGLRGLIMRRLNLGGRHV
jgi:hypothetical protein